MKNTGMIKLYPSGNGTGHFQDTGATYVKDLGPDREIVILLIRTVVIIGIYDY